MTAWRGRCGGQAAIEAALVLPLILALVLGVFAIGVVGRTDAALLAVAQEAARAAATSATASELPPMASRAGNRSPTATGSRAPRSC